MNANYTSTNYHGYMSSFEMHNMIEYTHNSHDIPGKFVIRECSNLKL